MAPKKDAGKKDAAAPEDKAAQELQQLEGETFDRGVELTFAKEKLRHVKDAHDVLTEQLDALKIKHSRATQDYTHILQHREGQIKASEARLGSLAAQNETLTTTLAERDASIRQQQETLGKYESKLQEAKTVLSDKEQLEENAMKQLEVINRQAEELANLKEALAERDAALSASQSDNATLQLKASATKQHYIFFDEPWIVETTYHKLRGAVPCDREGHCLLALQGLPQSRKKRNTLVNFSIIYEVSLRSRAEGSQSRADAQPLQSMTWELPSSARMHWQTVQASSAIMSSSKVYMQGGYRDQSLTTAAAVLNTEQWSWLQPKVRDGDNLFKPRVGHAMASIRSKIFVFGGLTEMGLSDELWIFDLETLSWAKIPTFGAAPCARKGASLVATDGGRKLYLFGGATATKVLNDVHILDAEHFSWTVLGTIGTCPPPREGATVSCLPPYILVAGGHTVNENGTRSLVTDSWVLHLQQSCWEQVDTGAWAHGLIWLKPGSSYFGIREDQIYILKPDREENLSELQVITLVLPEHLELMRGKKKKEEVVDVLELLPDAEVSSTSIEVVWRPPTKNADQIERYKLMMSLSTGVVREVAQGKFLRYVIGSLKPATDYVFCVKAIYTDGSYLWSDSRVFRTTSQGRRGG